MFGAGFNPVRIIAGGAIGALVTGGDPMMGAMTAGISAGVGACFEISPLAGVFGDVENSFFAALRFSTASGALAGGVTAEIFGGDFGEAAMWGAAGAAAGFVVHRAIQRMTLLGRGKVLLTYKTDASNEKQYKKISKSVDFVKFLLEIKKSETRDSHLFFC
jgi:hypothetical protein